MSLKGGYIQGCAYLPRPLPFEAVCIVDKQHFALFTQVANGRPAMDLGRVVQALPLLAPFSKETWKPPYGSTEVRMGPRAFFFSMTTVDELHLLPC